MKRNTIAQLLCPNTYPGRGIILGKSEDAHHLVIAYFIMGRSVNSRNRIFVEQEGGIRTEAFDPEKLSDPSLVIYAPVRKVGGATIVTNGDQTDTIRDTLLAGGSFEDALRSRTFEPDAPNYTPRISCLVENGSYKLSILKSNDNQPESVQRFFYEYPQPMAGEGHLLHTYLHDGDPIPSFEGEPARIELHGDIDAFTQELWSCLDEDNRVSLFTRYIDLSTGEEQTRILNKNQE